MSNKQRCQALVLIQGLLGIDRDVLRANAGPPNRVKPAVLGHPVPHRHDGSVTGSHPEAPRTMTFQQLSMSPLGGSGRQNGQIVRECIRLNCCSEDHNKMRALS